MTDRKSNFDKFFENYMHPKPPKIRNIALEETLRLGVEMRLMQLRQISRDQWPKLDDWVQCEICHGEGIDLKIRKRKKLMVPCHLCNGECGMSRQQYLATIIGAFGDVLQFGGENCTIAFKALVDAITLMCLYNPSEVVFDDITFPSVA